MKCQFAVLSSPRGSVSNLRRGVADRTRWMAHGTNIGRDGPSRSCPMMSLNRSVDGRPAGVSWAWRLSSAFWVRHRPRHSRRPTPLGDQRLRDAENGCPLSVGWPNTSHRTWWKLSSNPLAKRVPRSDGAQAHVDVWDRGSRSARRVGLRSGSRCSAKYADQV